MYKTDTYFGFCYFVLTDIIDERLLIAVIINTVWCNTV